MQTLYILILIIQLILCILLKMSGLLKPISKNHIITIKSNGLDEKGEVRKTLDY